jgi:hypothetical protein
VQHHYDQAHDEYGFDAFDAVDAAAEAWWVVGLARSEPVACSPKERRVGTKVWPRFAPRAARRERAWWWPPVGAPQSIDGIVSTANAVTRTTVPAGYVFLPTVKAARRIASDRQSA